MDRATMAAGGHLDLPVPWALEALLHDEPSIAEGGDGESLRSLECRLEFVGVPSDLHPDSATTCRCLHDDRIPEPFRDRGRVLDALDDPLAPGDDREADPPDEIAGGSLSPHRVHRCSRRADKHNPGLRARLGEGRILREEAIPRMDRLGARLLRDVENLSDVQVSFGELRSAQWDGFVRVPYERAARVGPRKDGDRPDA